MARSMLRLEDIYGSTYYFEVSHIIAVAETEHAEGNPEYCCRIYVTGSGCKDYFVMAHSVNDVQQMIWHINSEREVPANV